MTVMDISPVEYKESDFLSVTESVKTLKRISFDFEASQSKESIHKVINDEFEDKSMKLFVQSNLQQKDNGIFKWSFNIDQIHDAMEWDKRVSNFVQWKHFNFL